MQKCERSKSKTFTVSILYFFDSNKTYLVLENEPDKIEIAGGGSNNAEIWRWILQSPESRGFGGKSTDATAIFVCFIQKNTYF